MVTMLISIAALIVGYIFYGRLVEKVFAPSSTRPTPAYSHQDGVDYVPMPTWKVMMIQFLNIAGTGPIFGAILGAMFGPSCYLWIVFGCIFGGAVHDYLSGMLSLKNGGESLPDLVGRYLGGTVKKVMLCFSVLMLVLVGAVFVYSPAQILGDTTGGGSMAVLFWVFVVFAYYVLATLVPIDKIIGRIYPLFAIALIFMAIALLACLIVKWPSNVPEIWDGLQNMAPEKGRVFPCLFISIACGAVSGFHATQSPMMARCIKNETYGRRVFYGSMIIEGIIAIVWATISSYFFFAGGNVAMDAQNVTAAPTVVTVVSWKWLGSFGGLFALLGVVAAPITSGDTALRSARLIITDAFHIKQEKASARLMVSLPIFAVTALLLWFNIANEHGFNVIWQYFGWANQTLSIFTFWALTAFLVKYRKGLAYLITLFPACFMTSVCLTFICTAKIGFNISPAATPYLGLGTFLVSLILFFVVKSKMSRTPEF